MKAFRVVMDILIFLLLAAVLVWCAFLFWGAYSGHRISILVNKRVLNQIQTDIVNQVKGTGGRLDPNMTDKGIQGLKEAQQDLFDTNTTSFLFQFVTLVLVTIGVGILGYMYGIYRRAQEEAAKAQEKYAGIRQHMARLVKGRSSMVVLAVQFSRLHMFGMMYLSGDQRQREDLRIRPSLPAPFAPLYAPAGRWWTLSTRVLPPPRVRPPPASNLPGSPPRAIFGWTGS